MPFSSVWRVSPGRATQGSVLLHRATREARGPLPVPHGCVRFTYSAVRLPDSFRYPKWVQDRGVRRLKNKRGAAAPVVRSAAQHGGPWQGCGLKEPRSFRAGPGAKHR